MMLRFFIIVMLIIAMAGAMLHENGFSSDEMDNATVYLDWDNQNMSKLSLEGTNTNNSILTRVVYKTMDLSGFVVWNAVVGSLLFGYDNPQYNYSLGWKVLLISCFAFMIIPLVKLLIFLGYGIHQLARWIKMKVKQHDRT